MSPGLPIRHVLLAVDDSPAGLAAAATAVAVAHQCTATLHAVTVLLNGVLTERAMPPEIGEEGLQHALLRHVAALAGRQGMSVRGRTVVGDPGESILSEAVAVEADLIVIGRSDLRTLGQPYVGSEVRQVLEFAEVPVLVVPGP